MASGILYPDRFSFRQKLKGVKKARETDRNERKNINKEVEILKVNYRSELEKIFLTN